jgi:hypothetical protein
MPLNSPGSGNKYGELCNFLLSKINYIPLKPVEENAALNQLELKNWLSQNKILMRWFVMSYTEQTEKG